MTDSGLHTFYEDLVRQLRARGVVCGITSGLACVHYGVAESTKDCDLLCHAGSFPDLLELLGETAVDGRPCQYRGNISPPLDARWHQGGWTSHFEWVLPDDAVTLDVFGHALRESSPWGQEILGLYAGPHTVAEIKRTNRDKDWAFTTALGVRMIRAPLTYRQSRWTKEQLARLRAIERNFHVDACGEELARVNLEMTIEERRRYLAWMRETARRHGVKTGRSHPPGGIGPDEAIVVSPGEA